MVGHSSGWESCPALWIPNEDINKRIPETNKHRGSSINCSSQNSACLKKLPLRVARQNKTRGTI